MVEDQKQTMRVVLDEKVSQGEYVNFANIIHSPSEFVLDFGRIMPGRPEAKVYSRIVTSPQHAKQFLQALAQNVALYEQKFGQIQIFIAPPELAPDEPSN